jgi:leader peptidase (prepilin peptidase) / N-methyltransferase
MHFAVGLLVFILGAVIGSFLNVVIYRLPRRESVVFPRSACPTCRATIRPLDNIPLLSYLLLGGRCRACSARISSRYPAVEFLSAACTLSLYSLFGFSASLALYLPFAWSLIVLAFIDAEHQILPDRITYPGILLSSLVPLLGSLKGVMWGPVPGRLGWGDWGVGVALGAGIPYLVGEAYRLAQFRKPPAERLDGMGMGDVKMLAMIGGFLGWKLVLLTILVGSLLGSIWGLTGVALSRYGMKQALPFGTFLAIGAFLALTAGPFLLRWYAAASGLGG